MVDNEVQESVQEVTEQIAPTVEESPEPIAQAAPEPKKDLEYNFAQLRQQAEAAQRERDIMARELQEIRAKLEPQQVQEPEVDLQVAPDDYVEGKHLSAYDRKLKRLEKEVVAAKKETEQIAAEALIRSRYPDFDEVVTPESLQELQKNYPEIAATIATNKNFQTQAAAAYKIIKKLGTQANYQTEQSIIDKNQAKPRPVATLAPQHSDSPLTHANAFANGLTKELKERLNKEMEDAIRSR